MDGEGRKTATGATGIFSMKIEFLSLLFVAPVLYYAADLLFVEFHDPILNLRSVILASDRSPSPDKSPQRRKVKVLLGGIIAVLLISTANVAAIIAMAICGFTYLRWQQGQGSRTNARMRNKIESEFPTFVELFAILIVAGESPSLALLRTSQIAKGDLAEQIRESVAEMQQGASLSATLERLATTSGSTTIRRFCDSLIIALERGTPLGDVLYRQVEDIRKRHQSELLKQAGKAEIALMVPVVFLILPISVLFALWPSYLALGQSIL